MLQDNVILIGMMGSGKTTVGREFARLFGYTFFDLDEEIEKKHGKITDIFKNDGENYFRELETKELKNFIKSEKIILSTGGGTPIKEENQEILKKIGKIFYLNATAKTIYDRIKDQKTRPLLNTDNPQKAIEYILNSRQKTYEKCGKMVDVNNKAPNLVAKEIYEKLNR